MFRQRKNLCHLAPHLLLVGWFALTSSIVNACVVAPELRHEAGTSGYVLPQGAAAHAHHNSHANNAPCAKFSADESAVATAGKPPADLLSVPGSAPDASAVW